MLCYHGLALGAILPAHARALVAADVDVLSGEEVADVVEGLLDEGVDLLVAGAEDVSVYAPEFAGLVRAARATQLRVSGKGRHHVAGHVDLGHDGDVSLCGIFHDVANLVVGVVSTVRHAVLKLAVVACHGLRAL